MANKRGLATMASDVLGYQPKSLLNMHMKGLQDRYLKQNPQSAPAWLDNYRASSQRLHTRIAREPMGAQRAIYNHVLHTALGGKMDNLKHSDAEMRKFMKNLHKAHSGVAQHYGLDHESLAHPPFDHRAALAKGTQPPTMPPQVPQGGAPQGGVPSAQQHADTRAALGMNPMPPQDRHALPLSLAPGAGVPVAQKAMTPPPGALPS